MKQADKDVWFDIVKRCIRDYSAMTYVSYSAAIQMSCDAATTVLKTFNERYPEDDDDIDEDEVFENIQNHQVLKNCTAPTHCFKLDSLDDFDKKEVECSICGGTVPPMWAKWYTEGLEDEYARLRDWLGQSEKETD